MIIEADNNNIKKDNLKSNKINYNKEVYNNRLISIQKINFIFLPMV